MNEADMKTSLHNFPNIYVKNDIFTLTLTTFLYFQKTFWEAIKFVLSYLD